MYIVWREGGNAPTQKHETLQQAKTEAQRLAQKTPQFRYYVLESICSCGYDTFSWRNELGKTLEVEDSDPENREPVYQYEFRNNWYAESTGPYKNSNYGDEHFVWRIKPAEDEAHG